MKEASQKCRTTTARKHLFARLSRLLLLLVLPGVCGLHARGENSIQDTLILLKSVNIVDVERGRVRRGVDVLVADGHIKTIGRHLRSPLEARLVDEANAFVIPGLWDMHVHSAGLSADPAWSREILLSLFVSNGVTGVRDMGGNLTALQAWRNESSRFDFVAPQIAFAGPMLDGVSDDPNVIAVKTPDQARGAVDRLAAEHVDFIRCYLAWIEILTSLL